LYLRIHIVASIKIGSMATHVTCRTSYITNLREICVFNTTEYFSVPCATVAHHQDTHI